MTYRNWKLFFTLFLFFVCLAYPEIVSAHSGRTDAFGCHNCYTSYCYGEYHCHGGSITIPSGPTYLLPKPTNPENGNLNYKVSSDNWCNYDIDVTWDKPKNGDRFSIAASKSAGSDPGPRVDTYVPSFTLKNLNPGKWYVNIKTGNVERWSNVSYWTITLPKPIPGLDVQIVRHDNQQFLKYAITCLDRVEGPSEWIDYLKTNDNQASGEVLLQYGTPTKITIKAWDKAKKEYSYNLDYSPINIKSTNEEKANIDSSWYIIGGGFVAYLIYKLISKILP